MTFADHLSAHRNGDGSYDLDAAQDARIAEILADPGAIEGLAQAKAEGERRRWESQETKNLRKQFTQPALSPELELDIKVPLGDSTAVDLGDMNEERIRIRIDLRTDVHRAEIRAYDTEVGFWRDTQRVLAPRETIGEAIARLAGEAA